jgi:hypothetical protein
VLCQKCLGEVLSVVQERSPVTFEELDRDGHVVRRYTLYLCAGCLETILQASRIREAVT